MYHWCDKNTKEWAACLTEDDALESNVAFTNMEKCQSNLLSTRKLMEAAYGVILFFAQPFAMVLMAAQFCSAGVVIFGFLTAQENGYGGPKALGPETIVNIEPVTALENQGANNVEGTVKQHAAVKQKAKNVV